jgi:uncharacterized protein
MKRASTLVSLSLLAFTACSESNPMPPGNWTGRCPAPDAKATEFGPPPTTFVRDRARIFTGKFNADLETYLAAFQRETCHQLTVVTVDLEGQALESYALNYANRVGLGYRRLNNGVMLVISPKTSEARIQIGCGLEDVISDAQANEIMQRDILATMGEGSWQDAVSLSVNALMKLARKKPIEERFRPQGCKAQDAGSK